jgi:hypothetical protein
MFINFRHLCQLGGCLDRFISLLAMAAVFTLLFGCAGRAQAGNQGAPGPSVDAPIAQPQSGMQQNTSADIDNMENIDFEDPYLPEVSLPEPDASLGN